MIASCISSHCSERHQQTVDASWKMSTTTRAIGKRVAGAICLVSLCVLTPQARATAPGLVDDLRNMPGPWGRFAYPPAEYVVIGDSAFFFADDGISGVELWRTDGTEAGTRMVRDIFPGPGSSLPTSLTNLNGTLFFVADDGTHGVELWKSDGTAAGTRLVKDIRPGPDNSWPAELAVGRSLVFTILGSPGSDVVRGPQIASVHIPSAKLFFRADDGMHGSELWSSDGTAAGTTLVSDILPGAGSSGPQHLTDANGTLFFTAFTDAAGVELWKSDGTASGTQLVADIFPGPMDSAIGHLTPSSGRLFFTAIDMGHGVELWKSDGTTAGTQLVKDINDDPQGSSGITQSSSPRGLTNVNGTLFFSADDGIMEFQDNSTPDHGRELWRSDGTEAGTVLVKDISFRDVDHEFVPIAGSSPALLIDRDGVLFFVANELINGDHVNSSSVQVWRSDGTEAGTVRVSDVPRLNFNPFGNPPSIREPTDVDGTLFFAATDETGGLELWRSDGTMAGTNRVTDIRPGSSLGSAPRSLTDLNGKLLFEATTTGMNRQLWRSDGTEAGTTLVKDVQSQPGSAVPNSLADVNGTLFFAADGLLYGSMRGMELWKTDGTQVGTSLVDDLRPGIFGSIPRFLTNAGGTLFFAATNGSNGADVELWKLDSVTGLPVLVRDIRTAPAASSSPEFLTDFGGTLYFKAFLGRQSDDDHPTTANGHQLWKSDGTFAGTTLVADIWPNHTTSPYELTNVDGTLYMAADDGINGEELWMSDGTLAGTSMLMDIFPGADGSEPQELTGAGGVLFFVADDGTGNGRELWKSDGTIAGTQLVRDIRPGAITSNPRHLAGVGDTLYFAANDGPHGDELWISDGTAAGTVMVADLVPGPLSSLPSFIVDAGPGFGAVFAAYDVNVGVELWRSDGTAAGTMPITDIAPGIASSNPQFMTVSGGRLFFTANDHVNGWELWSFPLQ